MRCVTHGSWKMYVVTVWHGLQVELMSVKSERTAVPNIHIKRSYHEQRALQVFIVVQRNDRIDLMKWFTFNSLFLSVMGGRVDVSLTPDLLCVSLWELRRCRRRPRSSLWGAIDRLIESSFCPTRWNVQIDSNTNPGNTKGEQPFCQKKLLPWQQCVTAFIVLLFPIKTHQNIGLIKTQVCACACAWVWCYLHLTLVPDLAHLHLHQVTHLKSSSSQRSASSFPMTSGTSITPKYFHRPHLLGWTWTDLWNKYNCAVQF